MSDAGKDGWFAVPARAGFSRHAKHWDALNGRYCDANPYFCSDFIEPLVDYFATDDDLLWLHSVAGDVDGACIVNVAKRYRSSLFVPSQAQIAPIFAARPGDILILIEKISSFNLGLSLPCQDPLVSPVAGSLALPAVAKKHAHTAAVSLDGEFEDYWSGRSGNLRKGLGRRRRQVAAAGINMEFRHHTQPEDVGAAVVRFGDMESSGWKKAKGTAVHASNTQGQFYAELMRRFAVRGKASAFELYFDGQAVAIELAIRSENMLVLLKTTHDESWKKFSPGRFLLFEILQSEFEAKSVQTIEFYTSADENEMSWATNSRWIENTLIFRNALVGAVYKFLRRGNNPEG